MRIRSAIGALTAVAALSGIISTPASAEVNGCAAAVAMFFTPSSLNSSAFTCLAASVSEQSIEIFVAPPGSVSVSARKVTAGSTGSSWAWSISGLGANGNGNVNAVTTTTGGVVADTPEITMDPTVVSGEIFAKFTQGESYKVTYRTADKQV